jgi:hypothetical protein
MEDGRCTLAPLLLIILKVLSLLNITFLHLLAIQLLCFLQKARLFLIILSVRSSFLAATLEGSLQLLLDDLLDPSH